MQEKEELKTVENEKINKKTKKIIIASVLAVVIVLFTCVAGFSAVVLSYDKVFPGVTMGGFELGGYAFDDAERKLDAEFGKKLIDKNITVKLDESEISFIASDINAGLNIEESIKNLKEYGKKGNVFSRIKKYIAGKKTPVEIDVVASVDDNKLSYFIEELIGDKEIEIKETTFSVTDSELVIERGHGGRILDREVALKKIKKGIFTKGEENIELSFENVETKPIDIDSLYSEITRGKEDAFYERENGVIVVKGGYPEVKLEKSVLKDALSKNLEKTVIKIETIQPEKSKKALEEKLFRDKMGSWTSYFTGSNVSRSSNVHLTAKRINGITLLPGEVFSYDKTVGKRTVENGYKAATVYVGNKTEQGIGGGICQTSSTLYSAVLYANLEIVSRTSHSLPVSYMPPGQDATIAEGYIDFKFKNNTDYPVKIVASTTYGSVTCTIMGVKPEGEAVSVINTTTSTLKPKTERTLNSEIPKGYKKVAQKGVDGFTVSSVRVVSLNGKEVKRENLTKSVYRAQDYIIEVNPEDGGTPEENLGLFDPTAPPVIEDAAEVEMEVSSDKDETQEEQSNIIEDNQSEESELSEEKTESEGEDKNEQ